MKKSTRAGPTLTDTIHAKKIAAVLKKNPSLRQWAIGMFRTKKGRRNLMFLLHVEGIK